MPDVVETSQTLLETARKAFDDRKYANAQEHFHNAAEAMPGVLEPVLYENVCYFMSGQRKRADLAQVWEKIRPLLEHALKGEDPFAAVVEIKKAVAICTASVYRSANNQQMVEYANLNKDVKLEKKDFVFDEIRRILLEADEEYKVCLDVMRAFCGMVYDLPHQENAPESFFVAVLSYLKAAADLQNESNLEKYFPQLDLTAMACGLQIREDMADAIAIRNELLTLTLVGEPALARWEEFAPYAQAAGVHRDAIEKKVRRKQTLEKLKFWKEWTRKKR